MNGTCVRLGIGTFAAGILLSGCALFRAPQPEARPPAEPEVRYVRDPELEQRVARLELQLLEKQAQVEDLQTRLDEARREVVRAMAKLQTLASRAEAASAIAEAEIAIQTLRNTVGSERAPEVAQGRQLLQMSAREFDQQNYGGALYLANQAKSVVRSAGGRLGAGPLQSVRIDEVLFTVPLRLQARAGGNVREGPGLNFSVIFTAARGTPLTGHSYLGDWVRVSDERGRSGWIHLTLVGGRSESPTSG
jgi:uncharacterized coiled-coil protein SlyX